MGSGSRLGRAGSQDSEVARARSSSGALSMSGLREYVAPSPHKCGHHGLRREGSASPSPLAAPGPVRTRSAKEAPRRASRHGGQRSPGGFASNASVTPRTEGTVNSMDPNCRICMERVTLRDFEARRAMQLGCKCSSGLEIVHFPCAKRWFRIRRSVVCEICESEAKNLPDGLKKEIRELAAAAETARREEARERMRSLAQARVEALARSDEVHLCTYTTFCLLPAALAAIAMVFFFYEYMGLSVMFTMVFAILLSATTMLHWLAAPSRPVLHLAFVSFFLITIMGTTAFFFKIYGWKNMASSIIGSVVGGLFSTGLYAAARTAWGLWRQGGRVEGDDPESNSNMPTQTSWRQHSTAH